MQGGSTPRFDTHETEFALTFPAPLAARGMDYYVKLFEVYTPTPGEDGVGMQAIYEQLKGSHNLDMEAQAFFEGQFRPLMLQKIAAYCALHGLPGHGGGSPRYARGSGSSKKFYGIRLAPDGYGSDDE